MQHQENATSPTVGEIYVAKNYELDKFKPIPGDLNRDILTSKNKAHLAELGEAIKRTRRITPIYVNDKMEVLDGQNRLYWARKLNMDVRYIVEHGQGINYVRDENQHHKDWTLEDVIHSYANEGNENYKGILEMMKHFDLKDISFVAMCLSGKSKRSAKMKNELKNGLFVVESYKNAIRDYEKINRLVQETGLSLTGRQGMLYAMLRLVRQPWYDQNLMLARIAANSKLLRSCTSLNDYNVELLNIYNKDRQPKQKRFKFAD